MADPGGEIPSPTIIDSSNISGRPSYQTQISMETNHAGIDNFKQGLQNSQPRTQLGEKRGGPIGWLKSLFSRRGTVVAGAVVGVGLTAAASGTLAEANKNPNPNNPSVSGHEQTVESIPSMATPVNLQLRDELKGLGNHPAEVTDPREKALLINNTTPPTPIEHMSTDAIHAAGQTAEAKAEVTPTPAGATEDPAEAIKIMQDANKESAPKP